MPAIAEKIQSLDFERIKKKIIEKHGWTPERADEIEALYKGFFLECALRPDQEHTPTPDIDVMWHAHILDTRKYLRDCEEVLGFFLHHVPAYRMQAQDCSSCSSGDSTSSDSTTTNDGAATEVITCSTSSDTPKKKDQEEKNPEAPSERKRGWFPWPFGRNGDARMASTVVAVPS